MHLNVVPPQKGVYVLYLEIVQDSEFLVGSLGVVKLAKGTYLYIGSARGPGGLRARISRHFDKRKKIRWHIDYLTTHTNVILSGVTYAVTELDMESKLLHKLLTFSDVLGIAVPRFGSSDRRGDPSHLLRCYSEIETCIRAVEAAMKNLGLVPQTLIVDDEGPQPRIR